MKNIKNDIYSENDLNIPYSDKKYYYNNIGTIMSGQDFIGTNIKIGDNEDIVQHSTPIDSHLLNDGMDGTFLLHNNLCLNHVVLNNIQFHSNYNMINMFVKIKMNLFHQITYAIIQCKIVDVCV